MVLGLAAASAYVLVLTWPFSWSPPDILPNGARLGADGASMQFPSPGLIRTVEPPAWLATARQTGRLTISLNARPLTVAQRGRTPILSLARDSFERNLAISQKGADLVLSLRTPPAAGEGSRDGIEPLVRIPDVFRAGEWLELELAIAPGELRLRIGGEREIQRELTDQPLRPWVEDHRLAFGNEITGSRPWLGDLDRVVVRTGSASYEYPRSAGLEQPETLWVMSREPKLRPFRYLQRRDVVINLLLYAPLGFLLGISRRAGSRRAAIGALLSIAVLSGSLELAQLFVSVRNPSINDFILNLAGGGAGFAAARCLAALLKPCSTTPADR